MNKFNLLFIIFINLSIFYFAQNIPSVSRGSLQFYTDYSCFKGNENKSVVEIYVMLYADQLKYIRENNKTKANYKVEVIIKDSTGKIIKEQNWTTEVGQNQNKSQLKYYAVYDQCHAELFPGKYELTLAIKDAESGAAGTAETNLVVPNLLSDNIHLSQIEFINSVQSDNKETIFSKGNNSIIPNPSRRYGILNTTLYFYYEIYNITQSSNDTLTINYSVLDTNDIIVKKYPAINKVKTSSEAALIHGVDVSQIPTGIYKFKIEINDLSTKKKTETEEYFEVVQLDYVSNNNTVFTKEQAKTAANQIKYFASSREMEIYDKLDLSGKAQFLIRFWSRKDPTPGTEENEFLNEVKKRFQFANATFKTGKIEGWSTDRGRILIKYGNPDEIENHHFETGTVPYEIWIYRDKKSYQFVFADLQYNGKYTLIHSSKEGEVANYRWQEYIKRM